MHLTLAGDEVLLHLPLNELQRAVLALLTQRQREFLDLLGAGKCQKEIAAEMGISVRTVKYHAEQVRRKMHQ